MSNKITALKAWMAAATPAEQELLAKRLGSSRSTLYQISGAHRGVSAERAIAIERETKAMSKASKGRLPVVWRTDLSAACRGCEFARKCLGDEVVVRSEFPIVTEQDLPVDSEGGTPD